MLLLEIVGLRELRVIKPVEEVNSTWTRRCEADTQPAREFGVSAGHERGGFLMANLDKADIVLALPQRLHNPIDPVAGNSKYRVHTPIEEAVNKNISGGSCHGISEKLSARRHMPGIGTPFGVKTFYAC